MDAHIGYEQADLPDAVNERRREIIVATWTCDYQGLADAASHGTGLDYNDGKLSTSGPAHYFETLEKSGEPIGAVTRYIARTLETSPAEIMTKAWGRVFVWPAAAEAETPSDQQFDELEKVYEKLQVDEMRSDGKFHGYRLEITEDGDWISFLYQRY